MHIVPFIPESAPFTCEQRAWLNGYLAGLFSRGNVAPVAEAALPARSGSPNPAARNPDTLIPLTILFGSQTGTAEGLAKRAAKEAGRRGFAPTVRDMAGVSLEHLTHEQKVLVITSTYGEGEPPDNAKALHGALLSAVATKERVEGVASAGVTVGGAPPSSGRLGMLRYSVCGLGDTNYVQFCQCAKDFDALLEQLGGTRVSPLTECDLDEEAKISGWLVAALGALTTNAGSEFNVQGSELRRDAAPAEPESRNSDPGTGCSRRTPLPALVLASRRLNGPGSAKHVHHVELDLGDGGLAYEAGDALGVCAHNCPELVDDVLRALRRDGEEAVPAPDGSSVPLRRALTEFYDLGKPTPELTAKVGVCVQATGGSGDTSTLLLASAGQPGVSESSFHQVIDVLSAVPEGRIAPEEFVRVLKKLQPRLYSISSSPRAHAGQVHLTVGAVRYEKAGRARKGVCSTFLADRVVPGETRIPIYVHANKAFRLPASGDTPMIMVGPGTGIAPFRCFLHERRAREAKGKNWLLFGDQHAATDFLYHDELAELRRVGVLTRLDTAFSRDQPEKIYVQHRMLERAGELYAWLEDGAHFYVCGDANRMAKDVDAALHRVIEIGGGRTPEQAADYVQSLKIAKRYARDVY